MITLYPITERKLECDQIAYAPSRLYPPLTITEPEFLEDYADSAEMVLCSLDGVSQPQPVTGYRDFTRFSCWYIVAIREPEQEPELVRKERG